jgi:hypothetical protein
MFQSINDATIMYEAPTMMATTNWVTNHATIAIKHQANELRFCCLAKGLMVRGIKRNRKYSSSIRFSRFRVILRSVARKPNAPQSWLLPLAYS